MSIQRFDYDCAGFAEGYPPMSENTEGDYVLYADHLADKQAEIDKLQSDHAAEVARLEAIISDLQGAMRSTDPIQAANCRVMEYHQCKEEVARLTGERDSTRVSLDKACEEYRAISNQSDHWQVLYRQALAECDAAVAAKERAVNVLAELQWSYLYHGARCPHPSCHAFVEDGHVPECPIGQILAAARDAKPSICAECQHEDLSLDTACRAVPGVDACLKAAAKPRALETEQVLACKDCGWTGPQSDVVDDIHMYCPGCGSVRLRALEPEQGGPEGEE